MLSGLNLAALLIVTSTTNIVSLRRVLVQAGRKMKKRKIVDATMRFLSALDLFVMHLPLGLLVLTRYRTQDSIREWRFFPFSRVDSRRQGRLAGAGGAVPKRRLYKVYSIDVVFQRSTKCLWTDCCVS